MSQRMRVLVELDGDLAKGVDSSGTLRFVVMEFPAFLVLVEVQRHSDSDTGC
jgi:hypothetical protein